MWLESRRDLVAGGRWILVAQSNAAHRHAWNAEAALYAAAFHKRFGNLLPVRVVESFQRDDRFAFSLFGRQCTREHGLAVHQYRAAPALGLWLAAVLRRRNAQEIAQHVEQRE